MVKITKVYTRQGDMGETHLAGGHRIAKNSRRIEVIGNIDELNASVGLVLVLLNTIDTLSILKNRCIRTQHHLFNLGSQLAVLPEDRRQDTPLITNQTVLELEQEIDEMNTVLLPLNSFILPGGGEISARLHVARTICRRAERSLVSLFHELLHFDTIQLSYLNRLSDWLFVAARYAASKLNIEELLWQPDIGIKNKLF